MVGLVILVGFLWEKHFFRFLLRGFLVFNFRWFFVESVVSKLASCLVSRIWMMARDLGIIWDRIISLIFFRSTPWRVNRTGLIILLIVCLASISIRCLLVSLFLTNFFIIRQILLHPRLAVVVHWLDQLCLELLQLFRDHQRNRLHQRPLLLKYHGLLVAWDVDVYLILRNFNTQEDYPSWSVVVLLVDSFNRLQDLRRDIDVPFVHGNHVDRGCDRSRALRTAKPAVWNQTLNPSGSECDLEPLTLCFCLENLPKRIPKVLPFPRKISLSRTLYRSSMGSILGAPGALQSKHPLAQNSKTPKKIEKIRRNNYELPVLRLVSLMPISPL